ncbi:histone-fold-containing protein [Xylariomycetidae sp. FL0641]|nr:histone-fold-containing protein [Xylariomycetidae sp. FL0641]
MPPKKAEPARRSDVSTAHFVYDGDESEPTAAPPPPASHPAAAAPPPLKPSPSSAMDTDQPSEAGPSGDRERREGRERDTVTIEDLSLPKSIITRLAKGVLPPNTQIQANAILAMTKGATIFVNHLANAANEHTMGANKKTIMPNDVFEALEDIEFPFLRERLEAEFKKFNETQTTKRNTYRRRVAAQKRAEKAAAAGGDPNASTMSAAMADEASSTPRTKKQKPNAADESAMDVDVDETEELHDGDETEPDDEEGKHGDEDEDEDEPEEEQEDEDEENADELHEPLEERERREDDDDALDNGNESD